MKITTSDKIINIIRYKGTSVIIIDDASNAVVFSRATTHRNDVPDQIEVLSETTEDQIESPSLAPEDVEEEEENDLNICIRIELYSYQISER